MAKRADVPRQEQLITSVSDEVYGELSELEGQRIVHVRVWEESLADALEDGEVDPAAQEAFDLDLYLEDGVYFELYGVTCFGNLDAEPEVGIDRVSHTLLALVDRGVYLTEIAVDSADSLILVLAAGDRDRLYLLVGGWLLAEWDQLPAE